MVGGKSSTSSTSSKDSELGPKNAANGMNTWCAKMLSVDGIDRVTERFEGVLNEKRSTVGSFLYRKILEGMRGKVLCRDCHWVLS